MTVRCRLATTAALCLLPVALHAQGVRYGILLGANVSTITDAKKAVAGEVSATINTKRRKGFDGGIYVQIPLGGYVSLQPEAHYSQKGVSLVGIDPAVGSASLDYKIDYVEIPVLLRLDLRSKTAMLRPVLVAGASAALRISCKGALSGQSTNVSVDCDAAGTGTDPNADPFKKKDMSIVAGAGFALRAAGRSLLLQFRFTQGLTSVATEDADTNNTKPKNSMYSILVGFGF